MLCFFLAFISLIYFIAIGDGFFIVRDDFNEQQIPFTVGLHNALLDGGIGGWSWSTDLGGSTLQTYSFYELGSPFFWITMLFPAQAFPYLVGWIYILKYMVAGVLAFLYLRRFLSEEKWAILGAVIYAFSGFSTINLMYYHFHDVVALFPLLLIGLEILIEKKDFRLFTLAVFLNALLNYFFFIGEVVFLVFYYLFRFAISNADFEFKKFFNDILKCVGCGVLGVGMAAVLFIPSIKYISANPRASEHLGFSERFYDWRQLLYVIKGILLPAESMPDISAIYPSKFYSTACYLPMVGLVFVIAYLIRHRDWLSRIIFFLLIASLLPIIGNIFYLYTESQMRWWYMMVMMMALASCRLLEEYSCESNRAINIGLLINAITLIGFFSLVYFVIKADDGSSLVYSNKRFLLYFAIALFGLVCSFIVVRVFACNYKVILVTVSGFAVVTTALTMYVYRAGGKTVDVYAEQYEIACQIDLPNEQYRLNNGSNVFSMANNQSGFSLFSSTNANSIAEFELLFDYFDSVNGLNKNTYEGLSELLGGKYYVTTAPDGIGNIVTCYTAKDGALYYLLETEACPIGFAVSSVISESELKEIAVEQRAIALLSAAVVADDEIDSVVSSIDGLYLADSDTVDLDSSISDLVAKDAINAVSNFTKDGHGFSCSTSYDADTLVYFSVPNDEGWTAKIDGQQAEIINSGGMMLLAVPSGEHNIEFSYVTPYYKLGLCVSLVSFIVFFATCIYKGKRKEQSH